MEIDYIKIIITIILAVFGWVITHFLTTRRDQTVKRREITLNHLIENYRILTNEISHRPVTEERNKKIERMISDIQLFGSPSQIELIKTLATGFASGSNFELDPLINSLRDDLRKQLKLKKIEGNVVWVRPA